MASPPPVAAAAGPHSVFVYGTLMAEEVVRVLLGRAPPSSPAILADHRRFSIRGRVYPAILPARGHAVSGKVRVRLSLSTAETWRRTPPRQLSSESVASVLRPGSQGAHRQGTPCVRHVRGRGVCEDNRRGLTGCEYIATVFATSDSDRLPMLISHCSELLNLSSSDG